jgi:hypothetical protein
MAPSLLPPTAGRPFTPALSQFAFSYMGIVQFVRYGDLLAWAPELLSKAFSESGFELSEHADELSKYGQQLSGVAWFYIGTPHMRHDPVRFKKFWLDLAVCRMVDQFHAYIASMLRDIYVARPDILRAGTVSMGEVLECATIEEVVKRHAVKKVDGLVREGLVKIEEYLDKILGIKLSVDDHNALDAIAARNVIVHNGGRADRQFLRETDRSDLEIGS